MIAPGIVIDAVCAETRLTRRQLLSGSRKFRFVVARMLVILLLYREGYTDLRISYMLNRARCSVTLQRHKAMDYAATDKLFNKRLKTLTQTIEDARQRPAI